MSAKVMNSLAIMAVLVYCASAYGISPESITESSICNYRPDEVPSCGSACQTYCDTLGSTCPIINIRCNDYCYCKNGYARNSAGTCVPLNECPPPRPDLDTYVYSEEYMQRISEDGQQYKQNV